MEHERLLEIASGHPGLAGLSEHVETANAEIGRIFSVSVGQLLEMPDAEEKQEKIKGR
jgi:hypothetical protein